MTALTVRSNSSLEIRKSQEIEAIKQLPATYQKYALAKQSVKVSGLSKADGVKVINKLYLEVIFNLGWEKKAEDEQIKEDDRILTCGKLYDLIIDRYNSLTIDELKLAFLNGSIEDYGKIYGLGLKTLSDWLKGYSIDERKTKAMSEWNKMIDMVQVYKYSDEQKEQIIIDGCVHFFNDYKARKELSNFIMPVDHICAIFYDYLTEKGYINFTKERLKSIAVKAKDAYEAELSKAKLDRMIKKSDYELLMELAAKNENNPLKKKRRKLALIEYFDDLITLEEDLQTILNYKGCL